MPAHTGMDLRISISKPGKGRPVTAKNRRAALAAMLLSSQGRKGREVEIDRAPSPRSSRVTVSRRVTDCMTMRTS